ncbi:MULTISPECIES: amidohydrolase family protein [Actinomadura]|uniref:Amidohydrolase family protein n=1 Tax=Actinomadura litoris TaxID=2678616 RepID=A0A7K1L235_9ACTN|nr:MULTISPECIES: amidohydrolase family protein [Actinomadura]MBT2208988.1 amidohydrolase family protein [Actinomadura sp. NEAU-AAG7]MUN38447.1 amidohydrolase family protein [Actinomadura litoris]
MSPLGTPPAGMMIDVHGHLAAAGAGGLGPPSLFDPEGSIEAKREQGIGLTVIGSPCGAGSMLPGAAADNYKQPVAKVRAYNEAIGDLVDRFPDALRAYAYLDPFGGDAMLEQAAELTRDPRFVGLIVNSSVDGEYLSAPRADGFFAMAAETGVPVLVHPPAAPVGTAAMGGHLGLVEHAVRPCDITAGIAAIVCAGWLERYPAVRLIAAGGGGGLAHLPEKLDAAMRPWPGQPPSGPHGSPGTVVPSESLARIHVDTSFPNAAQLRANLTTFSASQILLGTDAPPLMDQLKPITDIIASELRDPAERERVAWRNAAELFDLA